MKQKLFFSIAFQICIFVSIFAQETESELVTKVQTIKKLAKQGYENYDPNTLIAAAKILLETPQIRPFHSSKFPNNFRSKYFDPNALLLAAYQFTPKNKKAKLKKIQKLQDQISTYEKMAFSDGTLWVHEIEELTGGEAQRFSLKFAARQNIEFRLDNEGELSLSVHFAKTQPSLKKAALDSPILFDYTAAKTANYDIEVKNLADSLAMDSILMVMY